MVAFRINRAASNEPSVETVNNGKDDFAKYYHHAEESSAKTLYSIASKFSFLKNLRIARAAFQWLLVATSPSFQAKEYFRR